MTNRKMNQNDICVGDAISFFYSGKCRSGVVEQLRETSFTLLILGGAKGVYKSFRWDRLGVLTDSYIAMRI